MIPESVSKTITNLRFPLIVMVVFIHSRVDNFFDCSGYILYNYISTCISRGICSIAVPLFFMVSGYLFFKEPFTWGIYFNKLKIRAKSILIPYLIWNLIVGGIYLLIDMFFPELMSGNFQGIANWSITDWLWSLWDTNRIFHISGYGHPICYQFWFLRDLMVMMVCGILIYYLTNYLKIFYIIIVFCCWIFLEADIICGLSWTAIAFFSLGCYFRINEIDFTNLVKTKYNYWVIFLIYLCLLSYIVFGRFDMAIRNVSIILGSILFIKLFNKNFISYNSKIEILSDSSFFIYAYHGLFILFFAKLLLKYIPINELSILIVYFIQPLIIILIGILLYKVVRRNKVLDTLLTGGR